MNNMIVLSASVPLWLRFHMSFWFIGLALFNLFWDASVVLVLLEAFKVKMKKDVQIRTILMAWVFGMISDFIIAMVLMIIANNIELFDIYAPFSSVLGIVTMVLIIFVSIILLYFMIKYLMERVAIGKQKAAKLALIVAILTAPYYILIPVNVAFNSFM